jgi:DNA-binding response OmpR family regulator
MPKRARILVIEDDPTIARTVAAALCDEGYDAHVVEGLASARREISRNAHAAVVLDLDLPDGAGELLLRDLARYDSPPAAVVVSAQEYAPRVASRWAVPHVMKPFDLNELIAAVRVAVDVRLVPRTFRASLL